MKIVKYLSIIVAGLAVFAACKKELSVESGYAGMVASGGLVKDSAGNCQTIVVNGTYYADSSLSDSNYVTVQVNIKTGGSYRIFTDTQNGFSFQDSGYIGGGIQSIRLKATGRPADARQTTFMVAFDTTFCNFTINVIGKTPATYSLVGSPDSCSRASVMGTYNAGTALTTSNQVSLAVNVTALGSYSVTTTNAGITFTGSGNFTTLGAQTITLQGSGTPTASGTYTFPITAGSSNCNFAVTVVAGGPGTPSSNPNDLDTAWSFSGGPKSFNGPFYDVFDTVYHDATSNTDFYSLVFLGYTPATGDTTMQLGVIFPAGSIKTGTFSSTKSTNVTTPYSAFYFTDYRDTSKPAPIYIADYTKIGVTTQVTIATYDSVSKMITGTFSGTAANSVNSPAPITNGRFRAKINH